MEALLKLIRHPSHLVTYTENTMITTSALGLFNIVKLIVLLEGIYTVLAYLIYRLFQRKKTVGIVYRIFALSTVIFCLFKWYVAIAVWIAYTIVHIIYWNGKFKNNDGSLLKRVLPFQVGSFALINIQMVLEKFPVFDTTCFSGVAIPDYILNVCCISGIMIVMYYPLRPLSLKGGPEYSGWKRDYTICFILCCALIHVIFFCLYFY